MKFAFPERTREWLNRLRLGALVIALFMVCVTALPLRTAVQIGADEGFEFAKATLALHGHRFYTEVWNDQPPLHTFLVVKLLRWFSGSILAPRLLTVLFGCILLISVFHLISPRGGPVVAFLTSIFIVLSPGFIALASSCMVEVPSLAAALAGSFFATRAAATGRISPALLSGFCWASSLQIKFISAFLLPLLAAWMILGERDWPSTRSQRRHVLTVFGISLGLFFIALGAATGDGGVIQELRQSWNSHFAATRSFEYGSPDDKPFDGWVLLRNWDLTVPALFGLLLLAHRRSETGFADWLPFLWFGVELAVFALHRPWWPYYYIHTAVPLCWCAASGMRRASTLDSRGFRRVAVAFCVLALAWMTGRVWVEIQNVRESPQVYNSLALQEMKRFRKGVEYMFADDPVYSFHLGIPLPPEIGTLTLKRFWSGEMTNARLSELMGKAKPGIVMLQNSNHELPFSALLNAEYILVYQDPGHRIYVLKALADTQEG